MKKYRIKQVIDINGISTYQPQFRVLFFLWSHYLNKGFLRYYYTYNECEDWLRKDKALSKQNTNKPIYHYI